MKTLSLPENETEGERLMPSHLVYRRFEPIYKGHEEWPTATGNVLMRAEEETQVIGEPKPPTMTFTKCCISEF